MAASRLKRVGIMTGGGDCPGLNAVIRAFVKTANNVYDWEVIGIEDGFEGLFRRGGTYELTSENVRGILPRGGTILGTSNRGDPFKYKQVVDGQVQVTDRSEEMLRRLRDLEIGVMVMIGGDGTMKIGIQLEELGIPVVGVPKTIDNDLSATDVTFGFDTAVRTATDAIDRLQSTAESHERVMILEVMGRHAGWIALHAGLAGGVEVILIPEIPFRIGKIVDHIELRYQRGRRFSIICVAEGAHPIGGSPFMASSRDPLGQPRLGGVGVWLSDQLAERLAYEVRATVLGHVQRGGTPSPYDRVLATRFGCEAAHLVGRGEYSRMVALRGTEIVSVTLPDACGALKTVPTDSELVQVSRDLGMSFGD